MTTSSPQADRGHRQSALKWTAVTAAELLIGIHLALAPAHLTQKFYIGLLFIVGSALLVAATLMLVAERLRTVGWILGAAVSAGLLAGFVASRTIGLPLGYHEGWTSSADDLLGLVSAAATVVFLVASAASLRLLRHPAGLAVRGEGAHPLAHPLAVTLAGLREPSDVQAARERPVAARR